MSHPYKLKYLFTAEYTDGRYHLQTPEDRSQLEPESRSEFYDVLQSGKTIKKFSLVGNGNSLTVDLTNGTFELNGTPFLAEHTQLPTLPDKFELIYYRQHTHNMNMTYALDTGNTTDGEEIDHFIQYFIGWKCNIKGKEYMQKIALA